MDFKKHKDEFLDSSLCFFRFIETFFLDGIFTAKIPLQIIFRKIDTLYNADFGRFWRGGIKMD